VVKLLSGRTAEKAKVPKTISRDFETLATQKDKSPPYGNTGVHIIPEGNGVILTVRLTLNPACRVPALLGGFIFYQTPFHYCTDNKVISNRLVSLRGHPKLYDFNCQIAFDVSTVHSTDPATLPMPPVQLFGL